MGPLVSTIWINYYYL